MPFIHSRLRVLSRVSLLLSSLSASRAPPRWSVQLPPKSRAPTLHSRRASHGHFQATIAAASPSHLLPRGAFTACTKYGLGTCAGIFRHSPGGLHGIDAHHLQLRLAPPPSTAASSSTFHYEYSMHPKRARPSALVCMRRPAPGRPSSRPPSTTDEVLAVDAPRAIATLQPQLFSSSQHRRRRRRRRRRPAMPLVSSSAQAWHDPA